MIILSCVSTFWQAISNDLKRGQAEINDLCGDMRYWSLRNGGHTGETEVPSRRLFDLSDSAMSLGRRCDRHISQLQTALATSSPASPSPSSVPLKSVSDTSHNLLEKHFLLQHICCVFDTNSVSVFVDEK
jgi:hypothetical protein